MIVKINRFTFNNELLPRNNREIEDFYRETTAKFCISAFRGAAKFRLFYRERFLPLDPTLQSLQNLLFLPPLTAHRLPCFSHSSLHQNFLFLLPLAALEFITSCFSHPSHRTSCCSHTSRLTELPCFSQPLQLPKFPFSHTHHGRITFCFSSTPHGSQNFLFLLSLTQNLDCFTTPHG